MRRAGGWRNLAMALAYCNVVFYVLGGSLLAAGIWLVAALGWTGLVVFDRPRGRSSGDLTAMLTLQQINARPVPVLPGSLRRSVIYLEPGEQVIPLPDGWKRTKTGYIRECSHWPRDEVTLSDGTTVAYICRRCDHDWVNEQWVLTP